MTSIKKNLTANFLSKIWTTLMSVVFLPYYIHWMGVEAYGLVGIYTALLALFSILDLGLGNTMNREMAQMSSQNVPSDLFRHLTRTLEWIYWMMALFIGAIVLAATPFLSEKWIHAQTLSPQTIRHAMYCIGAALAFLWPSSLYSGGLMGLQKQVLLNGIHIVCATLRGLGMVLVLAWISPTVEAFFTWQICVNILQTLLTAICFWKNLPSSEVSPRFDIKILWRLKAFAMGIAGSTMLAVLLAQMDKVILSRVLTLEVFGYYTLATTIASSLFYITVPVFSVFFPHFTQLVCSNTQEELKKIYHIGCQLMSALILPTALLAIVFSSELLFAWTQNKTTVENTQLLAQLLMIGTLFNALGTIPYALQLAYSWTKLSFYLNLFGVILIIPLLFWISKIYGAVGAAGIWILVNASFFLISIHMTHRKFLKTENWRWYLQDVGLPFGIAFGVIELGRWFFPAHYPGTFLTIVYLIGIYLLSLVAIIAVSSGTREWILKGINLRKSTGFKNNV